MTSPQTPPDDRTTRADIQLNLTAAGWAVVAMMGAALFLSSSSRLAIGFLIPLGAALAIDLYLSWVVVSRRSVHLTPSRTVVHNPDALPLRLSISGRPHPVIVTIAFADGKDIDVGITDETENIELTSPRTMVADFLRCSVVATVYGLAIARRWEVHRVPELHWAPAADPARLPTPAAVDEVARLRVYVPGDRMSRVSWPITARTGQMHVRAAGDGQEEFTVIVNLGAVDGPPGEGAIADAVLDSPLTEPHLAVLEATLGLASTLLSQLLEDGHQVRLVTTEVAAESRDELRNQAIDNPRVAPLLPAGSRLQLQTVDRFVTDEDDAARRLARAEVGPAVGWSYGPYVEVSMLGMRSLP